MSTSGKVSHKSATVNRQTVQIVRRQIVSEFDLVEGVDGGIGSILHEVVERIVEHTNVGDIDGPNSTFRVTDDVEFTVFGHDFIFAVKPEDES